MQRILQEAIASIEAVSTGPPSRPYFSLRLFFVAVATAVAYFGIAKVGIAWESGSGIASFWPTAGITAGVMIAFGTRVRPILVAAEFVAVTAANLTAGLDVGSSLVLGVGNPVESLMIAMLVRRFAGDLDFEKLGHLITFSLSAVASAVIVGLGVSSMLVLCGLQNDGFVTEWLSWIQADSAANITFAPLIVALPAVFRQPIPGRRLLEGFAGLALLTVAAVGIYADAFPFATVPVTILKLLPTSLFLFPLVIWIAARMPTVFSAAAVFLAALVIVYCSTHGLGRFGSPTSPEADRVIAAQISMVMFGLATLAIAALFGERRRAERSLTVVNQELSQLSSELETRVHERTRELSVANDRLTREAEERERMTRELAQREAWLRAAQAVAGVGSFSLAREPMRAAHWSDEALRIFGLAGDLRSVTIDRFVGLVVYPADRMRVRQALDAAVEQRVSTSIEYRILRSHGNERIVLTALEPRSSAAGEATVLCTALDVTERNQTEQKLAEYRNDLLHMVRVATAGELATIMAHEVNQPLSAISHTASALIRLDSAGLLDPGEMSENLSEISAQAQRASAIIRHIRQFVQKRTVAPKRLLMDDVVRDVLALLEPVARRLDVRLSVIKQGQAAAIVGEEVQIGQLLVNLVRNAIDAVAGASPDDRLVSIKVEGFASEVVVTVEDCGPGFSSASRERMFEPFFTTKGEGLGMGLPIARTIAEAHGGKLEMTDRCDRRGVEARVTFPAARERSNDGERGAS